jgi:acyl-coenzyme A synthetase/AMP-(fatty) acid ligase
MTPGRRERDGRNHLLSATFVGGTGRPLLQEGGERWTVDRLLAYAGDIERAIPAGAGRLVAVRSHSAAFVMAALLGLWKAGRSPLLVDPDLTSEPAGLRSRGERIPVIAPAGVADPWGDVAVKESGGEPVRPGFPRPDACEVAFFTSGSTGEPKTVRKTASQLAEQYRVEAPWLGLSTGTSTLCLVPPFHILGYIYGFYWPAASSGTAAFNRVQSPQQWVDQIRELQPNLVVGVPAHYRLITQVLAGTLPPAVYLCSGAPLDPAICDEFQRRAGSPVYQVYGSTETGGIATRAGAGPWRTFPTLAWQVREPDGRLLVRSAWQDDPDEWHPTGDAAEAEGDTFRLLGRVDSVVKIGGRRFSSGEIVQAALEEPRVDRAHAIVYSRFGELAVALFAVPRQGLLLTPAELRTFVAGRLAPFKVPRTIHVLSELPTRSLGKVDEGALRHMVSAGTRQVARSTSSP